MTGVENFIQYCEEYLEERWEKINKKAKDGLEDALGEKYLSLKSNIIDCLKSPTKSYHYVLPTQLLSKAVEHSRDGRSLQASYDKPGAFDARSIAHRVIVPFDEKNHNVLGGSPEPYVNNPLRCPAVTAEYEGRQKNKEDWRKLVEILEYVERKDEREFTGKIFDQVLIEIFRLLAEVDVIYPTPGRVSLQKTIALIKEFTAESSGGERIEAVVTALFREIGQRFSLFDDIKREKVNAADRASGMAGDIECYCGGQAAVLVEVKDKALSLRQLASKLDTARARKIKELLIIAEKGVEQDSEQELEKRINSEFTSGQNVYITDLIEFAYGLLILFGEEGRVSFLRRVGPELDRVNALIFHRQAWAKLLREA